MAAQLFFWIICFVILSLAGEVSLSNSNDSKYMCSGDSIKLFQNVHVDSRLTNVTMMIYRNDTEGQHIARWTLQNTNISYRYSNKVLLDNNGDIWIFKVHPTDEALYCLNYQIGSMVLNFTLNLKVYAAPANDCKPTIKRVNDTLQALLEDKDCGLPAASASWLYYPYIQYKGNGWAVLPPKNKTGTYYACIEGPALSCARISSLLEHCSSIQVFDTGSETNAESSHSTDLFAMLIAISVMLSLGLVVLIINTCMNFKQCWSQRKIVQAKYRSLKNKPSDQ